MVFLTADKKLLFDGKAVDHNSLIACLREAGFTKESTVVLKFSPDARVKELHWPLWRLRTSRWNKVRIELPAAARDG